MGGEVKCVHLDPCEEAYDTPLLYEGGWGKQLNYCVAFSPREVIDVSKRYTRKWQEVCARRIAMSEEQLDAILTALHTHHTHTMGLSDEQIRGLAARQVAERALLASYVEAKTDTIAANGNGGELGPRTTL
eukprot:GDKI01001309.1.p2 GENE.GDKI01001309.1~~GDKI01001309.1.p2  ORF type:complete len:131 (-),score=33.68 GDKI01001309.1:131-523(-)